METIDRSKITNPYVNFIIENINMDYGDRKTTVADRLLAQNVDFEKEYELIKEKKSTRSKAERDFIVEYMEKNDETLRRK